MNRDHFKQSVDKVKSASVSDLSSQSVNFMFMLCREMKVRWSRGTSMLAGWWIASPMPRKYGTAHGGPRGARASISSSPSSEESCMEISSSVGSSKSMLLAVAPLAVPGLAVLGLSSATYIPVSLITWEWIEVKLSDYLGTWKDYLGTLNDYLDTMNDYLFMCRPIKQTWIEICIQKGALHV